MLSICIPIYNFDVTSLVTELVNQSSGLSVKTEIILIDDKSKKEIKNLNEAVCSKHIYIQLEKNIGRSAIRNKFIEYAQYDYMLFLDCDSCINTSDFLHNYINEIKEYSSVVVLPQISNPLQIFPHIVKPQRVIGNT